MPLNPKMLEECKDIIFNKSELRESVKEPVHIAVKTLIVLEYSYKDFLSREVAGETKRALPIVELITLHGGNAEEFVIWFSSYETPNTAMSQKVSSDSEPAPGWGT